MKKKIDLSAIIYSDGCRGYNGLVDLVDIGYDKHLRINHKKDEFSNHKGTHILTVLKVSGHSVNAD